MLQEFHVVALFVTQQQEIAAILVNCQLKKNVFEGIFEGIDYLKYNGVSMFIFSPQNNTSMFSVINENCRGIFTIGGKSFAITGLGSCGKIYELVLTQDNCIANEVVNIGCYPETFLTIKDTAYIATRTSILVFKGINYIN
jgi:hypothetical protein